LRAVPALPFGIPKVGNRLQEGGVRVLAHSQGTAVVIAAEDHMRAWETIHWLGVVSLKGHTTTHRQGQPARRNMTHKVPSHDVFASDGHQGNPPVLARDNC